MKKIVLMLFALSMLMVSSVVYADTTEVQPASEPTFEETLGLEVLKFANEKLENDLKEGHPELYEAFSRTLDTPYGFNMNVNLIANVNETMAEELGVRRIVAQMYANGYINMPAKQAEMKLNMNIDAGAALNESIEGVEVRMIDDLIYSYDPSASYWSEETLDYADLGMMGNPMEQQSIGYMAPFADKMTKRETVNGMVYSLSMTGEDIKDSINETFGESVYDAFMSGVESEGVMFEIPTFKMDYVIKDGVIRAQHTEIELNLVVDGEAINLMMAVDGEYYSYGLQKEVVAPVME
ncbi:MAG: hypothetical protein JXO44_01110 [Clostridia bacterium]|nr:hypothetical protein [Clostridia bacterium]